MVHRVQAAFLRRQRSRGSGQMGAMEGRGWGLFWGFVGGYEILSSFLLGSSLNRGPLVLSPREGRDQIDLLGLSVDPSEEWAGQGMGKVWGPDALSGANGGGGRARVGRGLPCTWYLAGSGVGRSQMKES